MDEFTYDTVPDNYREKYEKCQKNRIDAFVIVAGYGVLLIAVMLQAVGVLAGWRPVLAMIALAAAGGGGGGGGSQYPVPPVVIIAPAKNWPR